MELDKLQKQACIGITVTMKVCPLTIHTFIIGHYNPSVRIKAQLLTPLMQCVNFIRKRRELQFNVDSERQISEKVFHGRFISSQNFCQKSAERKSTKKYFSYFIFDDSPRIRTQAFASNKPTHQTTETSTADNYTFDIVKEFIYLGSAGGLEIERGITLPNRCSYGVKRQLSSIDLSRPTKLILYKTLILPMLLYDALRVFERKAQRMIFGINIRRQRWLAYVPSIGVTNWRRRARSRRVWVNINREAEEIFTEMCKLEILNCYM